MTLLDLSWDRESWQRKLAEVERELERQARHAPQKPAAAPLRRDAPRLPEGTLREEPETRLESLLRWVLP